MTDLACDIRAARESDSAALAAIEAEARPGGLGESAITGWLRSRTTLALVGERDGRVIGHVLLQVIPDEAEVLTLAVRPSAQRRGIGRALLVAAIEAGATARVFLEVHSGNAPAIALYESRGFSVAGKRSAYYRDGGDAWVMSWSRS